MFNLARQAFVNPFQSSVGSPLQLGAVGSAGRCPLCGNAVGIGSTIQPQSAGFNPMGIGAAFGQQVGSIPTPYALSQATGFGQINPLAAQFTGGVIPSINPMVAQLGTNLPGQFPLQGVGGRLGAFGIDPRHAFGGVQQFGYADPSQVAGFNPSIAGDPLGSVLSQQWNQPGQQQLPIRSLIGAQQGLGSQSPFQGFGLPTTQWADPYRAFIEAQLISQLANNPLYQLQRAYGGIHEATGLGMPFGVGQQFNPLFHNVPFQQ